MVTPSPAATIPRTHSSVSETPPACRFKQRDAKFVFQLLNGRCPRRLRNIEFLLPLPVGRTYVGTTCGRSGRLRQCDRSARHDGGPSFLTTHRQRSILV